MEPGYCSSTTPLCKPAHTFVHLTEESKQICTTLHNSIAFPRGLVVFFTSVMVKCFTSESCSLLPRSDLHTRLPLLKFTTSCPLTSPIVTANSGFHFTNNAFMCTGLGLGPVISTTINIQIAKQHIWGIPRQLHLSHLDFLLCLFMPF